MNKLGMRQDELNEKVDLTNELVVEEQTEKENAKKKKIMEMKFPEFNPKLDTLDLDPPDIITRKQKRKKNRPSHRVVNPSLIPILLFSTFATLL